MGVLGVKAEGTGVPVGVPDAEATTQFNKSFPFSFVANRFVLEVKLVSEFHVVDKLLLVEGGALAASSAAYAAAITII